MILFNFYSLYFISMNHPVAKITWNYKLENIKIILTYTYYTPYNVYKEVYKMRTNVVLDDNLVKEAFKLTGIKTKKKLISIALNELVEQKKRKNLLELKGKIDFAKNYNYKSLRRGK